MTTLLEIIANDLRKFSESLEKKSILLDYPWALIDEEFEMQKLIFRKNKQLILAKNGLVQEGTWLLGLNGETSYWDGSFSPVTINCVT